MNYRQAAKELREHRIWAVAFILGIPEDGVRWYFNKFYPLAP